MPSPSPGSWSTADKALAWSGQRQGVLEAAAQARVLEDQSGMHQLHRCETGHLTREIGAMQLEPVKAGMALADRVQVGPVDVQPHDTADSGAIDPFQPVSSSNP